MDRREDSPVSLEDLPVSLPRTCSISDLTKLFKRTRSAMSQSRATSRRSENSVSENSQILYMADPKKLKSRKARQSLSSIGNNADRRFDGSTDEKEDYHDLEALSWDVIDQEIYEWQYVCQTGRPYWWSPESRYRRLKIYQPRLMNEASPRFWMRKLEARPKSAYAEKRRAVSDNYFCDPGTSHDLAHLVAVQLLGACFTLPPDHILGIPAPNYALDKTTAALPDPRMISSLRMHTQFRYSPSFGHQARNTSPVQAWPRSLGILSAGLSSRKPEVGPSTSTPRRTARRRTLTLSNGSGSGGSFESDGDQLTRSCSSNDGLDHAEFAQLHLSKGPSHPYHASMRMPNTMGQVTEVTKRRRIKRRKDGSTLSQEETTPKTNYRLEPVIRSEPHHVFIQPVRELVVKRWTNFKRRLSGSLHSALPTRSSDDQASTSESGSPAMSSDGKLRRLRAQERGDIHSSDVETTQHFNTPTGGNFSPVGGTSTPDRINGAADQLLNPSIAEAALSAAKGRETGSPSPVTVRSRKHVSPSESSLQPMGHQARFEAQAPAMPTRPPFPLYSPARFNPPAAPSNTFPSRRRPTRQQRKSTLSEMYTPDDNPGTGVASLAGRKVSSAPATANVTPLEESKQELGADITSFTSVLMNPARTSRPRIGRTSTSGTQIFTPADDGIELDGLPVGPLGLTWIGHGRRERTYL
ncbi:hypothetical protein IFR04_010809 [Cadophora malorum]|uniref:Uncharacterized protein n=1 Tax=Cadophora malorum TaxID=108018 RepID=A0A8H7TBZ3_9HELO|nr:hypothetical protein IFR04_010809 [Cadophora malorum]